MWKFLKTGKTRKWLPASSKVQGKREGGKGGRKDKGELTSHALPHFQETSIPHSLYTPTLPLRPSHSAIPRLARLPDAQDPTPPLSGSQLPPQTSVSARTC